MLVLVLVLVLRREATELALVFVTMLAPIATKFDGVTESWVQYDACSDVGDLGSFAEYERERVYEYVGRSALGLTACPSVRDSRGDACAVTHEVV